MALYLSIGSLKPALCWSRYRDAIPVPTSPLAYDITTAPSGPVINTFRRLFYYILLWVNQWKVICYLVVIEWYTIISVF